MVVYIAVNGVTTGPFGKAALEAKIASGELTGTTMVWQDGMPAWAPAADVEAVAALIEAAAGQEPAEAEFDPAAFIVGTWRSAQGSEIFVPELGQKARFSAMQMIGADGSIRVEGRLDVVVQGIPLTMTLLVDGSYSTTATGPGSFMVTPRATGQMIVPGMPPEVGPYTDPSIYVVIDENTIRDNEGITWTRS